MTLGEHLEELRRRLLFGIIGLVLATFVCLYFGERVMEFFCAPLLDGLKAAGLNTQTFNNEMTAPFMLYLKVSLICAACLAGPWMLYQVWQFVAAGLYPHERKTVTKFIPLSVLLLISGMVLAYFLVMPITVSFLLSWQMGLHSKEVVGTVELAADQVVKVPQIMGDPKSVAEGQIWFNLLQGRLKMCLGGVTRVIPFGPDSMVSPQITVNDYVDLTLMTLLVFAVAFQLPLVVLALFKVGIIDVETLKKSRRYVYFILSIVAAVLAPGDVLSAMFALYVPLILLYEFGIMLCWWTSRGSPRPLGDES